ncbi:plasmid pRiA4b ORF-3 family protein [Roseibium sp. RKSG952]|uniref:plasmid pRiA4b ORF-3 family protein n=1 Tax=Roseibium sp. RKSG952 TaxID=2529384 RepID=UPI0012BBE960|nr:plasmid pRiA4b ORF-3 family protein [Roseibium sp. RKSG952]MTH95720.1 plasmid pRiA4b ORF-3 family protein [Roseibium sp. RKSG952]
MSEPVIRLLIELDDIEPRIWRRVDVPAGATLEALHDTIQAVMRWEHAHLWEFQLENRRYGEPMPSFGDLGGRVYKAKGFKLDRLAGLGIKEFSYIYDFGDDWRCTIRVEDHRDGDESTNYPVFVDGERAAPPEDIGGVPGFLEFLDVIADPKHPQHSELLDWVGGEFDPADTNPQDIERDLAMLAEFRRRARVGHNKRGVWTRG